MRLALNKYVTKHQIIMSHRPESFVSTTRYFVFYKLDDFNLLGYSSKFKINKILKGKFYGSINPNLHIEPNLLYMILLEGLSNFQDSINFEKKENFICSNTYTIVYNSKHFTHLVSTNDTKFVPHKNLWVSPNTKNRFFF